MGGQSFEDIVASIRKPLDYASKDGFARIGTLRGVSTLVDDLCGRLLLMDTSPENSRIIKELRELFKGFDEAGAEDRKWAVSRGIELAGSLEDGRLPPGRPVRPDLVGQTPPPSLVEIRNSLARLSTPIECVRGIGPKLGARLRKKGLSTVEDVLYFLPIRYEDRTLLARIRELEPGSPASVLCEVLALGEARYGRRKVFEIAVGDGTGIMRLKWFNYRAAYMKRYHQGQRLVAYGPVSAFGASKEMVHPDIEVLDAGEPAGPSPGDGVPSRGLVPVYSQVENIHARTLRKIIGGVVSEYAGAFVGGLPAGVTARRGLMAPADAVRAVHCLDGLADGPGAVDTARKSLVFDELFLLETGLAMKRRRARSERGISLAPPGRGAAGLEERLLGLVPFMLTGAQERVLEEIRADMASPHPMNRLIQGDVGSGKTIVSFIAALRAVEAGYQAAIMAPTEILAEQHYLGVHSYAEALGIRPVLLTGRLTAAERRSALKLAARGEADLIVGTHALIQKDVEFKKLGLVVIDEQHRFGVAQRATLRTKVASDGSVSPDVLIMTATPIPRTLSMTVFGDLDVSIIDELPPGRHPVATRIVREKDRARAYDVISREVRAGGQAYIVYPLVEESEELSLKDATNMKEHLASRVFTEFRVGLLHGRMKSADKEAVMRSFKDGEVDILVATTVIEVGVDVPGATVMLVEHAERFGLAQLHQLRGRVGRGSRPATCLLLAQWTRSEDTYRRLRVMETTQDGFRIAEEDLKIRGPGDFIGTRQ
ncbi:MAG: ATP-dependent DNA helicase RecG, partial [Thermodesulfobacteriota bacterium]